MAKHMQLYDVTFSPISARSTSSAISYEIRICTFGQREPESIAFLDEEEKLFGAFNDLRISPTNQTAIINSLKRGEPYQLNKVGLDPEQVALFGWTA